MGFASRPSDYPASFLAVPARRWWDLQGGNGYVALSTQRPVALLRAVAWRGVTPCNVSGNGR